MGRQRAALVVAALAAAVASCERGTVARAAHEPGALVPAQCPRTAPEDSRCWTLFVHENRASRTGRVIPLQIVILPALEQNREGGPVFVLAGGPGQAASHLIGYTGLPDPVRARHDIVLVDQRGTGGSNALTCAFYGPRMDVAGYFKPFMPLDKVRACRDALRSKADLTQYTTAAAVDDLEDVRAALGYARINLAGLSYGTRLAMEYVRKYEPRVRSVLLEGVVTPSVHMPEDFGIFAQHALDALFDECAATPDCARAFPAIREQARVVFARVKEQPVRTSVPHPGSGQPTEVLLTHEHVAEEIRYMMYTSYEAARVPLVLEAAYRGDFSPIARSLLRRRGDGSFDGIYLSITCTEDVPFLASDAGTREAGTYLAGYRVREQQAACAEWPRGPAPDWLGRPVAANVPVLLLSGALDPATPPSNGDAVAEMLPHSVHVTIPFGGHSPAGLAGLDCLQNLKADFIERASVQNLDIGCVARITRPAFATTAPR